MRKYLIIFAVLVFAISCERDVVQPTAGEPMSVAIEPAMNEQQPFAAQSRADKFTFFAEGAQVGLYMVNYTGLVLNPAPVAGVLKNTGNHADNNCFIAGSDNVLRKLPPLFYPMPDTAILVDIYAYYPYTDLMKNDVTKCPFEVSVDQSDTVKAAASDLCWAKNLRASENVGIAPSPKPVAMEFVHKFSKIRVAINVGSLSPSGKVVMGISNVKINGAFCAATLNLATGVVALKNGASDLRTSITPLVVADGAPATKPYVYDVIVPAQTFLSGYNLVTFDLNYYDGKSSALSYKVSDATFGTSKTATLAGKIHKINLTLGEAWEITLTGSQITDWTTGITQGGEVDNSVTTTFKVTLNDAGVTNVNRVVMKTDFEGVFDIKTGVTFAGGVCKFKFEKGKSPRDYGFRITSLQFFEDATQKTAEIVKTSPRVYTTGEMDLGTW